MNQLKFPKMQMIF